MTDTASTTTPAAGAPAISIEEIEMVFPSPGGEVRALDRVSLVIRQNEFFTLLGPSGCGKTTLLRLIAGFEEPTAGGIFLAGRPIAGLPPHRRPVNTVFQSYALFPHMTVAGNVGFGLEMKGYDAADRAERIERMLSLVRLSGYERRKPAQLSGGQQQRVALARALASEPEVLLLDEPLSALDLKLRKDMQIELKRLQRETGVTFVFVTHDQEEALTMSDRLAVMNEGQVLQIGSPREIYDRPVRRFVADFIGDTNLIEVAVVAAGDGAVDYDLGAGMRIAGRPGDGLAAGERATIAIRPERLRLHAPESAAGAAATLQGRVDNVVYSGTDTTYHLSLADGRPVRARLQNAGGAEAAFDAGDDVAIGVPPEAVQVLAD